MQSDIKQRQCANEKSHSLFHGHEHEEFLFCDSLLGTKNATGVFNMLKSFLTKLDVNWKNKLGSLCTDEVSAMLGNTSGFAALFKKKVPNVTITHRF